MYIYEIVKGERDGKERKSGTETEPEMCVYSSSVSSACLFVGVSGVCPPLGALREQQSRA